MGRACGSDRCMGSRSRFGDCVTGSEERHMPAVEMRDLSKRFGRIAALQGISLRVAWGEVVALVGPNGAGKTTALRILSGLIRRFDGTALVDGCVPWEPRPERAVGVLIEAPAYYPYLTVESNLRFFAGLAAAPDERVHAVIDDVGLGSVGGRRAGDLSHGMKQRLGLAIALLRNPQVLLLDEPLTGLDPAAQRRMRELISQQAGQGTAIVISTHNLAEVEAVADRLAFLSAGRIVADGGVDDFGSVHMVTVSIADAEAAKGVLERHDYSVISVGDASVGVALPDGGPEEIVRVLALAGLFPHEVRLERPSLEDVYLKLIGGDIP